MTRILIADDDAASASFAFRVVRRALPCARVETAASGREALELLLSATCDLAILDQLMPGLSGLQVLKHLRGRGVDVPVLLLTEWATRELARAAAALGAEDLLEKPIIAPGLALSVRRIAGRARQGARRGAGS
ncbi:MAG: response regulator [Gemmatimonadota bacterium]